MAAVVASLTFLARECDPDGALNPRTPQRKDLMVHRPVEMLDGREAAASEAWLPQLDKRGFSLATQFNSQVPLAVLRDPSQVMRSGYATEVEQMLLRALPQVGFCFAFNFVLRKTDLLVHTLPADDKSTRGPVNDVHSDYTDDSFVIKAINDRRDKLGLGGARCMILNVWRPLLEPGKLLESWPLCVCDSSSVASADIAERESPENKSWIQNAYHSPGQRWNWFPAMASDEAIVFKTFESDRVEGVSPFALHCSFDQQQSQDVEAQPQVRESIEVRVACFVTQPDLGEAAFQVWSPQQYLAWSTFTHSRTYYLDPP